MLTNISPILSLGSHDLIERPSFEISTGDDAKYPVAAAGDVNGDGFDDYIVGQPGENSSAGRVRVFSGIDNSVLHTVNGYSTNDYFGTSVAGGEDFNGDGFDDFIVGAPGRDTYGPDSGQILIFSGQSGAAIGVANGQTGDEQFGFSVAMYPDSDGDGDPNFVVGSLFFGANNNGRVSFFSGIGVTPFQTVTGNANSLLGRAVASAGDVNRDGVADVIIAGFQDSAGAGTALVVDGATPSTTIHTFNGGAGDGLGFSVAGAGDVDGDGFDDVIVGSVNDSAGGSFAGSANVFSGQTGAALHTFIGDEANGFLGYSVSGGGDINGDGFDDFVVGGYGENAGAGAVHVFSGVDASVLQETSGNGTERLGYAVALVGDMNTDGYPDLAATAGRTTAGSLSGGRVVTWVSQPSNGFFQFEGDDFFDAFGAEVSGIGDVNGDGFDDFAIGAPFDDDGGYNAGSVRVFSGFDKSVIYTLNGSNANSGFGGTFSGVGDIDGDGLDDIIIGASGQGTSGAIRIVKGTNGSLIREVLGSDAGDSFGSAVAGLGDITGDGVGDYVVGALFDDTAGTDAGQVIVYCGSDGAVIYTINGSTPDLLFGSHVAGVGDVTGDDIPDFAAGSIRDDTNGMDAGSVQIFDGATGAVVRTAFGEAASDSLFLVEGAGDVDADGVGDYIIGTRNDDGNGSNAGVVTVYSGASGQVLHTFRGENANDQLGFDFNSAGDFNGDGFDDIIVGSNGPSKLAGGSAGRAQIFSGSDGRLLFEFEGDNTSRFLGRSVSGAGDVNGDGFDDVLIGRYEVGLGNGSAQLILGQPTASTTQINGNSANDRSGISVASAGDVNGDGFDDFIIGAVGDSTNGANAGAARVYSGRDNQLLHAVFGDSAGDVFGSSVSGAGDVNNDGFDDFIVGARGDDNSGSYSGSARVFSGRDGSILHSLDGYAAGDDFGVSVAGVGDINGDGFDDFAVGAYDSDANGTDSGNVQIFSGADASVIHLFLGDAAGDKLGGAVAAAGDVNGDGVPDVVAGATRADSGGTDFGAAKVFSGASGATLFIFDGIATNEFFGTSVDGAGDVNGDGFADIIVGASSDATNGINAGRVEVFSGVDGSSLFSLFGESVGANFGRSVSAAGDVNGDGLADFIVGALNNSDFLAASGQATVFSGADGSRLALFNGDQGIDRFGISLDHAGDLNGDGFADLVIGAYRSDTVATDAGSTTVYLGSASGFVPMSAPVKPFDSIGINGRDDDQLAGVIIAIQGPRDSAGEDRIIAPDDLPTGILSTGFNPDDGTIAFIGNASANTYKRLLLDVLVTPSTLGGGRSLTVTIIDTGEPNGFGPAETGQDTALVRSDRFDFGDAPDTFDTTLAENGPRHQLSNLFLGSQIDVMSDAIVSADATADDLLGGSVNDDDGIAFTSPIARGQGGTIEVVASGAGTLAFWIDYDQSGTFDESERREEDVVAGVNTVTFAAPGSAIVGDTFARFRLSSDADAVELPTGAARDGEVEDYAVTVLQTQREWGDAPASYSAGGGTPFHNRGTNIHWLGAGRSLEPTPNINADATGDDLDDGVTFLTPLARNQGTTARVIASEAGELSYWIDFDNSGAFDAGEMFTKSLNAGPNLISFVTPGSAVLGDTFARFRFASSAVASPVGAASNGEVEDYQVEILTTQREYGDAPDSYRTSTATNGARHNLGPNTHFLGTAVDREPDANISLQADADDTTDLNDDDGVTFTSLIAAGQTASVDVVASRPGELSYWIDFDLSGTFDNATERFTATLAQGSNSLTYAVPANAVIGNTFARFRFSTNAAQIVNPFGVASNGEVEDYRVEIVPTQADFGDAPDSYGTSLSNNGAQHAQGTGNVFLGTSRDLEADGVPSGFANSDDAGGVPNDEDGITFTSGILAGQMATFTAVSSASGTLTWWIDSNFNGTFDNPSERFSSAVTPGSNNLAFVVPSGFVGGDTYIRFRLNSLPVNSPVGLADDGEVEDYRVTIAIPPVLQAADSFFANENDLAELISSLT